MFLFWTMAKAYKSGPKPDHYDNGPGFTLSDPPFVGLIPKHLLFATEKSGRKKDFIGQQKKKKTISTKIIIQ